MLDSEEKASQTILNQGKTLLYPTDTVYGIGCDAKNFEAVHIKLREALVNDLESYFDID